MGPDPRTEEAPTLEPEEAPTLEPEEDDDNTGPSFFFLWFLIYFLTSHNHRKNKIFSKMVSQSKPFLQNVFLCKDFFSYRQDKTKK